MLTFNSNRIPFHNRRVSTYERPLSGKQFHKMSEFAHDCDFSPEELVWFTKFKDQT